MWFGFGFGIGARMRADKSLGGAEEVFCKCTEVYANMGAGKMAAKNMVFAAPCSWSVKFYNTDGGAQIGVTKTGTYNGSTPATTTGVTVSDGVNVVAKYTCTTTAPGYKGVPTETVLFTLTMLNGTGDVGPYVPAEPA